MKTFDEILQANLTATLFVVTLGGSQSESETRLDNQMLPKFSTQASETETTVLINIDPGISQSEEIKIGNLTVYNLAMSYAADKPPVLLRSHSHFFSDYRPVTKEDVGQLNTIINDERKLVIVDYTSPLAACGRDLYSRIENKTNTLLIVGYEACCPAVVVVTPEDLSDSWYKKDSYTLLGNISNIELDTVRRAGIEVPVRESDSLILWSEQPAEVRYSLINNRLPKIAIDERVINIFPSMNDIDYSYLSTILIDRHRLPENRP